MRRLTPEKTLNINVREAWREGCYQSYDVEFIGTVSPTLSEFKQW